MTWTLLIPVFNFSLLLLRSEWCREAERTAGGVCVMMVVTAVGASQAKIKWPALNLTTVGYITM
jgi:hypothetical protein